MNDRWADQKAQMDYDTSASMSIPLPMVASGQVVGEINLSTMTYSSEGATPIAFTCQSHIECCSTMRIPITSFDIDRIEGQGYALDQIVESLSPFLLPSKTPEGTSEKAYLIKRKPYAGTCTFLDGDKCRIHAFKPFACRIYPFALDIIDEHRIQIQVHPEQLCTAIQRAPTHAGNNVILQEMLHLISDELVLRGRLSKKGK